METVSSSVYQIRTPMGPHFVNSHLVVGYRFAILIDTGLPQTYELVQRTMKALNLPSDFMRFVLITHGHPDHIGANAQFKQNHAVQIIAPATAVGWIEDHQRQYQEFPSAFPDAFQVDDNFRQAWFGLMDDETQVDVAFQGSIRINLGGGVILESAEYPGHSSHETGYYEFDTRCLILGDAIALDHPDGFPAYEHPAVYRDSLKRILVALENNDIEHLVAGHFEVMDQQEAKALLQRSIQRIDEIEAAVLSAVQERRSGLTLREACQEVAKKIGRTFNFQTPWTVYGHLKHLTEAGRLSKKDDLWLLP